MVRFLFASDSFKGTISSARAAELLTDAARARFPRAECRRTLVADGGEGTVDAVVGATGGKVVTVRVEGPRGVALEARYGMLPGRRAVIETAAASGLPLLAVADRDPLATSTFGTGQLILDALDRGATDVSLAVGGSATNDGGMGCMRALGVRFLDASGLELAGKGADLGRVASIDLTGMDRRVRSTTFHVMCDVDNPLVGPRGCAAVFAPQKGATPEVVARLEAGMVSFAAVLERTFNTSVTDGSGMGAAGGLGAAARLFLDARVVPGIDWVLELVEFDALLDGVDLCVTGEGHADSQSAHGKVMSGVAAACRRNGVPCVAIVGGMSVDARELLSCGIAALVPTVIDAGSIEDVLGHAEENYRFAAERVFSLVAIGMRLHLGDIESILKNAR